MCEHCMTCSGEHKKEDTTKNIETDSVTIWLPGPGPVIQCSNVDTVSLPHPCPRPRLDREGGSVADISELIKVI